MTRRRVTVTHNREYELRWVQTGSERLGNRAWASLVALLSSQPVVL